MYKNILQGTKIFSKTFSEKFKRKCARNAVGSSKTKTDIVTFETAGGKQISNHIIIFSTKDNTCKFNPVYFVFERAVQQLHLEVTFKSNNVTTGLCSKYIANGCEISQGSKRQIVGTLKKQIHHSIEKLNYRRRAKMKIH